MSKPFDYFQYKNGKLSCESIELEALGSQYGTPLYVYSERAFFNAYHTFKKHLGDLDTLICFAVKSNSNLKILNLFKNWGAGVDLVSGGELFRAERAGFSADRIVFSGVGKTAREIVQGLDYQKSGILSFHVESIEELELIERIAQEKNKQAPITLRFNPDVNAKTHPYISTGLKKNKFGLSQKEILKIIKDYSASPHLLFKGLSIHIGSQLTSLPPLKESFEKQKELAIKIQTHFNSTQSSQKLEWVDLGGGIGIQYKNEKTIRLEDYCKTVRKLFTEKKWTQFWNNATPRILFEPGRIMSGNSGVLLTQILFRKNRDQKDFIIVDAAMNDLMRPSLYESYHEIVPTRKINSPLKKSDVVGPVCESSDFLATDRKIQTKLKTGDYLSVMSSGAYGFSMSSQYNSRPKAAEILVKMDGSFQVIRERETYSDLIRGETLS